MLLPLKMKIGAAKSRREMDLRPVEARFDHNDLPAETEARAAAIQTLWPRLTGCCGTPFTKAVKARKWRFQPAPWR